MGRYQVEENKKLEGGWHKKLGPENLVHTHHGASAVCGLVLLGSYHMSHIDATCVVVVARSHRDRIDSAGLGGDEDVVKRSTKFMGDDNT